MLYRARNAIERMFCRLKDFRRIATRYDRLATNFLAAICLAATVSYWLQGGAGTCRSALNTLVFRAPMCDGAHQPKLT